MSVCVRQNTLPSNALTAVIILLCLLLTERGLAAPITPLKAHPGIWYAQLDNGLKVFLQPHADPQNRDGLELRLVVNVGSLAETPEQSGFAHFVEHLAFNGSQDFPGLSMQTQLRELGANSAQHNNAFTSYDQTFYFLTLADNQDQTLDAGLNIVWNWAFGNIFDSRSVDLEKRIIGEERRLRGEQIPSPQQSWERLILSGSSYASHPPIGTEVSVNQANKNRLRNFYQTWYQPHNMALIATGNFDAESLYAKIQPRFSHTGNNTRQASSPPAPQQTLAVDKGQQTTRYAIVQDPHGNSHWASLNLVLPYGDLPENSVEPDIVTAIIGLMLQNRIRASTEDQYEAILTTYIESNRLYEYGMLLRIHSMVTQEQADNGLIQLAQEWQRSCQHPFQDVELQWAAGHINDGYQDFLEGYIGSSNRELSEAIQRHFIYGSPLAEPSQLQQQQQTIVSKLTIDKINYQQQRLCQTRHQAIGLTIPTHSNSTTLDAKTLQQRIEATHQVQMSAPVVHLHEPQVTTPAQRGKITESVFHSPLNATLLTLSNQSQVLLLPTRLKGKVYFSSVTPGGLLATGLDSSATAMIAMKAYNNNSLDELTAHQMQQWLERRRADVDWFVGRHYHGIHGSFAKQDVETFLSLIHHWHRQSDLNAASFARAKQEVREYHHSYQQSARGQLDSTVSASLYANSPLYRAPNLQEIDAVNIESVESLHQKLFGQTGNTLFVFAGDLHQTQLSNLIERYLANLPTGTSTKTLRDQLNFQGPQHHSQVGNPQDRSDVTVSFTRSKQQWSPEVDFQLHFLARVLEMALQDKIRTEHGLVYHIGSELSTNQPPQEYVSFQIQFTTLAQNRQQVLRLINDVIDDLQKNGPNAEQIDTLSKSVMNDFRANFGNIEGYVYMLTDTLLQGHWFNQLWKQTDYVEAVSAQHIKTLANEYLQPQYRLIAELNP